MEFLTDPQLLIAFLTLTALELVLGIDNVIFISILVDKLPPEKRVFARRLGLFLAMFMRLALLAALSWMAGMTEPVLTVLGQAFSGRDLILIAGGLFLLYKSTVEIQAHVEGDDEQAQVASRAPRGLAATLVQIALIDVVFSLDSVITAVGMAQHLEVMVLAIVVSVLFMMLASGTIADFVSQNPTLDVLALAFLMLIGVALVGEGFDMHIPKAYIYFAMGFSVAVEMLNTRRRRNLARRRAAAS